MLPEPEKHDSGGETYGQVAFDSSKRGIAEYQERIRQIRANISTRDNRTELRLKHEVQYILSKPKERETPGRFSLLSMLSRRRQG